MSEAPTTGCTGSELLVCRAGLSRSWSVTPPSRRGGLRCGVPSSEARLRALGS